MMGVMLNSEKPSSSSSGNRIQPSREEKAIRVSELAINAVIITGFRPSLSEIEPPKKAPTAPAACMMDREAPARKMSLPCSVRKVGRYVVTLTKAKARVSKSRLWTAHDPIL